MNVSQLHQPNFQLFDINLVDEVCIVDDEPSFLFLNETIFKLTHPSVKRLTFGNIKDIFIHLQLHPNTRRVVLLDIHIGLTTGFELLDMLNPSAFANTTVIIHSTCNDNEFVRKGFSYSLVKAFIVKPLSLEIVELISGAKVWASNGDDFGKFIKLKTETV